MTQDVRVRFAPSPTGEPHVGNIRTVIFNWLFAKQNGGKFVVRLEDTDRNRYEPESVKAIAEILTWLGLDPDEGLDRDGPYGPYTQSERLPLYKQYALELIEKDAAYYCDCTPERLKAVNEERRAAKQPPGYDGHCRTRTPDSFDFDQPHVIRQKIPREGLTEFDDLIRGTVSFENEKINDQVLLKSDGFPTYHLAVVVDDYLMKITHIIRGDDWIPSTPKHVLMYDALGWEKPTFAHVPRVLGNDGKKLSKRHGATSVLEFKQTGYLSEALVNFLALLGWSTSEDTDEIFTLDELVARFDLNAVNRAPARFDYTKLDWMNGVYIRDLSVDAFVARLAGFFAMNAQEIDPERLKAIAPAIQTQVKTLTEAGPLLEFLTGSIRAPDTADFKKVKPPPETLAGYLETTIARLDSLDDWSEAGVEGVVSGLLAEFEEKPRNYYSLLRIAVTRQKVSPPIFPAIVAVGKADAAARMEETRQFLLAQES